MNTIFRKVSVKERLPIHNLDRVYDTNNGKTYLDEMNNWSSANVEWWLEPIELPSDKIIIESAKLLYKDYPVQMEVQSVTHQRMARFNFAFDIGAKWIRSLIQSKNESSVICEHPFAFVQSRCNGEINHCLKCGANL